MPEADPREEAPIPVIEAVRFLRAGFVGALTFDEHTRDVRFVLDPRTGRIVMPVMAAAVLASQHVLHTPDEDEDSMRVLLSPDPIDRQRDPLADRWRAYHGEEPDVHFVACDIDMARWRGCVFDGAALMAPNPFADQESALLRELNADPERLRRACALAAGVEVAAPVAVGVDALGVDIRARFGVVRVEFPRALESADDVRAIFNTMAQSENG